MQVEVGWTAQEEQTITHIMADEAVSRIEAIQAMRRRLKASRSISHRLKLRDPFDSDVRCQAEKCWECAVATGEVEPEMASFIEIMLDGRDRFEEYIPVRPDPVTKLYPVSAKTDDTATNGDWGLIRTEEASLELTSDGAIEGRVYVRKPTPPDTLGNAEKTLSEAIRGTNVDGLMPILKGVARPPIPESPIKALRGRPTVTDQQKRQAATERQARWRRKAA
jgi:hypothetical protein